MLVSHINIQKVIVCAFFLKIKRSHRFLNEKIKITSFSL